MSKKTIKPIAAVVGVAFVSSMVISGSALASENPFEADDLESGYMLAGDKDKDKEGECGEGSCGEEEEGSCGEGSCGEDDGEEGSCGEGSCGEDDG
ncbi:MAG TPA: hypothetical protein VJ984_05310 [Xanthomonadales bacterium]|nr:hypothetical protein [Xanthomonadales bacterium]